MSTIWIILFTAAATLFISFFLRNLSTGERKIDREIEPLYGIEDEPFRRAVGHLLGPPIVCGNKIDTLINGDEIFPAMLEAIRGAERTIVFETFIYWSGSIARAMTEALVERAQAGVQAHENGSPRM